MKLINFVSFAAAFFTVFVLSGCLVQPSYAGDWFSYSKRPITVRFGACRDKRDQACSLPASRTMVLPRTYIIYLPETQYARRYDEMPDVVNVPRSVDLSLAYKEGKIIGSSPKWKTGDEPTRVRITIHSPGYLPDKIQPIGLSKLKLTGELNNLQEYNGKQYLGELENGVYYINCGRKTPLGDVETKCSYHADFGNEVFIKAQFLDFRAEGSTIESAIKRIGVVRDLICPQLECSHSLPETANGQPITFPRIHEEPGPKPKAKVMDSSCLNSRSSLIVFLCRLSGGA